MTSFEAETKRFGVWLRGIQKVNKRAQRVGSEKFQDNSGKKFLPDMLIESVPCPINENPVLITVRPFIYVQLL